MEIVRLKNYTFRYPNADRDAVCNVDVSVNKSEFVLVCGPSGCGKTTLLRSLKKEITPHGEFSGEILFDGKPLNDLTPMESACKIGFVRQNPDNQIVTDKVWHELAFGLENLGLPTPVIRRRVAETAHFFGITPWFEKNVFELSGGQKQILNLAAVMAMQPKVLILDEPTAQLDPIAAKEFLTVLQRINRELGTTVILSEHRLEEVLHLADKVLLMKKAQTEFFGKAAELIEMLADQKAHEFISALPSASKIAMELGDKKDIPVTVREGRVWLKEKSDGNVLITIKDIPNELRKEKPVLEAKDVWFRYTDSYVLQNFSTSIYSGRMLCIVGGNGSGKTTALSALAGILKPVRGKVHLNGKSIDKYKNGEIYKSGVAKLEQNPKTMFACDTVIEDLKETGANEDKIEEIISMMGLSELLSKHPYDLSGGEQQKAALAKLLLTEPKVLLLDEPTKGIDIYAKDELAGILKQRCKNGDAVVIVTHDIEFAAKHADECEMIFGGEVMCRGGAKEFFSGNMFYTTSANRIARGIIPDAVTVKDVTDACKRD